MSFTITLFYAGLLALVLLALSMQVVVLRRRHGVGVGSGDRQDLGLAVRAQANFCEYVPVGLLLLLLLEAAGTLSPVLLHMLGAMLLVGRLMHGFFGLNRSAGTSMGRFVGTLLTWLMIGAAALFSVGLAIGWWLSGV